MYVVTGVTGRTGRVVALRLLAEGEPVRVVLRDISKAAQWQERGAEVVVADFSDVEGMAAAFAGATAAYLVKPPGYDREDLFEHAQRTTDAVTEAIRRAGLPKLVLLSSIGADRDGVGVIATNRMAEQRMATLGIPVAFLRAAYFMENWQRVFAVAASEGVLPSLLAPVDKALPMIATADIGDVAADMLRQSWEGRRIINLEGPQARSPDEIARALGHALGRTVTAAALDENAWEGVLAQNPFSRTAIRGFVEMNQAINSGHIAFDHEGAEHVRGHRSFEDVVAGMALPLSR